MVLQIEKLEKMPDSGYKGPKTGLNKDKNTLLSAQNRNL
jgi:hypothetical protein